MSRDMTDSEAIANLNHIYGFLSPDIQRSLDVAFKALEERPQGEWEVLVDKYNVQTCKCSICGRIEVISHYDFDKIPFCHCGADMRKPNCVTCDHFGKCEGCEKGEEE